MTGSLCIFTQFVRFLPILLLPPAAAHELSYFFWPYCVACRILSSLDSPLYKSELMPLQWILRVLTTALPGKLPYGSSVYFVRNLMLFFLSGCPSLHSPLHCMKISFSPRPHQPTLVISYLFVAAVLLGVRWHLTVVSVSVPLMLSTFSCTCCPSVCLRQDVYSGPFLKLHCLVFLMLSCKFFILDVKPMADIRFANIFSHSVTGCLSFWWWFPLLCRSFLVWYSPFCLFLLLWPFLLLSDLETSLPHWWQECVAYVLL